MGSCRIASESYVWLLAAEVFMIPEACLRVMSCCRLSLLQLRVSSNVSFFSGRGSLLSNFSMCVIAVVCASLGVLGLAFPILLSEPCFHSFSPAEEFLSILVCYFCMLAKHSFNGAIFTRFFFFFNSREFCCEFFFSEYPSSACLEA